MDAGILLPTVMQWDAQDFGLHTLEVVLDGHRQRTVAIYVRHSEELTAESSTEEPEQT